MKKLLPLLLLLIIVSASCRETWTQSTKNKFNEGCMDEATKWAGSPELAKTYCDCVLAKIMAKYPHEDDALEHIDSLATDPNLINCKDEIMKTWCKHTGLGVTLKHLVNTNSAHQISQPEHIHKLYGGVLPTAGFALYYGEGTHALHSEYIKDQQRQTGS